jgi:hypothetical protein
LFDLGEERPGQAFELVGSDADGVADAKFHH